MEEILSRLDKMQADITNIQKDITDIKESVKHLSPMVENMDNHVEFINSVYARVERPFHFVCNKVSKYMGRVEDDQPPPIENNTK